jgi:hypothetical protein
MRKTILATLCSFAILSSSGQTVPDYASIKLETKSDYTPEVDKKALQAASHLLTTPPGKEDPSRINATQFLMRWMTGTPSYTFELDATVAKISDARQELLIVYLAAMVSYAMENPSEGKDKLKMKVGTAKRLLQYCQQHNIKLSGELKKLNKAAEAGGLDKYLGKED